MLSPASTTMTASPNPACKHHRTQLIAKDSDAQYVECLDCGEIFEAQELEKQEKKEGAGFGESLSDA
jgi:Zn ribbon nucleic-acid-binding protein